MGLVILFVGLVCSTLVFAPGVSAQQFVMAKPASGTSAISGRVVDASGQPVAGLYLRALQRSYIRGRRYLSFVESNPATTDSDGKYRVSGISSGKYYLQIFRSNRFKNIGYPAEFYPGTHLMNAVAISVPADSEATGIDIRVGFRDGFAIHGRLQGAMEDGQFLTVVQKDGTRGVGIYSNLGSDGSFTLAGFGPGSYWIQPLPAVSNSHAWTAVGRTEVVVTDRDVNGVALNVTYGMNISGSVRMEDGTRPTQVPTIHLLEEEYSIPGREPGQRVRNDGTFLLERVNPFRYRVEVVDLPDSSYVRSIHFATDEGSKDVSQTHLDLTGLPERGVVTGSLDVTIATGAGIVTGSVPAEKSGTTVVVALWSINASGEVRVAPVTAGQPFHIASLAPGLYRLLAWEGIEPAAAEYPPYLSLFASQASTITVQTGQQQVPDVKLISADVARAALENLP